MKKTILFVFIFISILSAQDSLYLVNTLVGKTQNRLIGAKAAGDINGDGYDDLVVSFTDSVKIYLGNERFALKAAYAYGNNNGFVLCPGDVNNDGYADLLLGYKRFETGTDGHISNINLFFGGSDGLDSCKTFDYGVSLWDQILSKNVEPIGDVNGDGFNDFAISSPYNWSNGISYVFLYLGGDSISSQPFVTLTNYLNNHSLGIFGESVCGIGDVNRDGFDDILVGDPGYDDTLYAESSGAAFLYYGGAEMDSIADSLLTFNDEYFGSNIKNLGDINDDGSTDFAVTGYDSCVIFLGLDSMIITRFYNPSHGIGGNGDINNDRISDFIIGYIKGEKGDSSGMECFLGKKDIDLIPDYYANEEQKYSSYAIYTDFIGDFNGDGYDDIFVVASTFRKNDQEIGKLYVYSIKKINGIKEVKSHGIDGFQLLPGSPNPFNNRILIPFQLKTTSEIQIDIYDIRGRLIKTLFSGKKTVGVHRLSWDGKTNSGQEAASGLYFVVLKLNNTNLNMYTRKIVLLK